MIHRIASALGYLLYTGVVLLALLWFLFPADSVRLWVEAQLDQINPSLAWRIQDLQLTPMGLVAADINITGRDQLHTPFVQVDRLRIRPDLMKLLRTNETLLLYQAKVLGGTVWGRAALTGNRVDVTCSGTLKDVQIDRMKGVWQVLGRSASGGLSGRFSFQGPWRRPTQGCLRVDLVVTHGAIDLQQPVLGLEQLEFSRAVAVVSLRNRVVTVKQGKVESRLLSGEYEGTVILSPYFLESVLRIQGFLEPRPELLSGLHDEMMVSLIRKQLRDGKLPFTVSGTVLNPGILFKGTSGVIDGIIQRGAR